MWARPLEFVPRQARSRHSGCESVVRSWKRRDWRDLQHLQNSDERTQGAHLPQEKKMEVPQVRQSQDARTKISLETNRPAIPKGSQLVLLCHIVGRFPGGRLARSFTPDHSPDGATAAVCTPTAAAPGTG